MSLAAKGSQKTKPINHSIIKQNRNQSVNQNVSKSNEQLTQ